MKRKNTILYGLITLAAFAIVAGLAVLVTRSGPPAVGAEGSSQSAAGDSVFRSDTATVVDAAPDSKVPAAPSSSDAPSMASSKASSSATSKISSSTSSRAGGYTREELAAELNDWNLFLVNPDHTIGEDWKPSDLKSLGNDQSLDSRAYSAYNAMVSAAKKDGVSLWAVSGYRSYSKQNRLYNNRVDRSKRENPSLSQAEAEADAAQYVARPGTSEHQLGLAVDFNSVETSFSDTKAGKWLKQHAAEYGFILRYEKEKQSITKVTYEPWHYRYVGAKHALTMQEKGMCMEEYIDWLKGN